MLSFSKRTIFAAIAVAGLIGPSQQAEAWLEAGVLTCEDSGGFSLILSSPRDLHCVFHRANGLTEAYRGRLREVGRNLGATGAGVIAWSVVADKTDGPPGALSGTYRWAGSAGSEPAWADTGATKGAGGEGRGLVGGPRRTVTLQPLRVGGNAGLNLAVGIAAMELHPLFETTVRTAPTRVPAGGLGDDLARPGQVLVVPARAAASLAPPVRFVANEILLEPVARDLQFAEVGPARIMSRPRQPGGASGQDQACVDDLAKTLGIDRDRVRVTSRDVVRNGDALVYLYADGTRAACEVDRTSTVRGTRRMIPVRVTSAPPSTASGAGSNAGSLVERACMDAVRRQAGRYRAIIVLGNAVSQANSTVTVGVGARRAPWRCVASNDGVVTDLSFAGDDSAGVRDAGAPMPGRTTLPPAR
ncbi:DUF992 domain-containing protein [Microbaculum marinisediminis]|uniref:DUF992 domain-containing protein n=1 Tax=Microbaculum marinisediminis TaxID=2931392 RepID=A0AAW5QYA1_9HYPH|nr:DUF992 domain-containing protein [Microbaculum sp. A6E488]MCT8972534.1 DUF992 domain-containing protein [Microbaculum sp. A6E488]